MTESIKSMCHLWEPRVPSKEYNSLCSVNAHILHAENSHKEWGGEHFIQFSPLYFILSIRFEISGWEGKQVYYKFLTAKGERTKRGWKIIFVK